MKPGRRRAQLAVVVASLGMAAVALAPHSASADDAARISRLESEIQLLRTQIDEQSRRIQRLEAELKRRADGPAVEPRARTRDGEMRAERTASARPLPWHAAEAWARIEKGMTADEVTAMLGAPTAVESVDSLKTLFYRGAGPGGAALSGHVNLRDDRVVAVSKPEFQAKPNP
jgi:cell division protein FtsB